MSLLSPDVCLLCFRLKTIANHEDVSLIQNAINIVKSTIEETDVEMGRAKCHFVIKKLHFVSDKQVNHTVIVVFRRGCFLGANPQNESNRVNENSIKMHKNMQNSMEIPPRNFFLPSACIQQLCCNIKVR